MSESKTRFVDRYMVRTKRWFGFFGQRHGFLGEPVYDFSTTFHATLERAIAVARETGCDCCARPPKSIQLGRWYRTSYADRVMVRRAPSRKAARR